MKQIKLERPLGNDRRNFWLAIAILTITPLLLYWPSLHAPFILDDSPKIAENPDIRSLDKIKTKLIYSYKERTRTFVGNDPSRPVVYLTYILNYYYGKLDTFGYHVVNVFLHCLNALLVFLISQRLLKYLYEEKTILIPFLTSILFACNPTNTHVVSYIYSRSDALAALFYMLSILCFMTVIDGKRWFVIPALICFVLSLFSKQMAITLPAVLLLLDYFIVSDRNMEKIAKNKFYHASFWILALAYLLFRFFYFGGIGDLEAQETLDRYSYFISSPYIIISYIRLLIFPAGLCLDHVVVPSSTIINPKILMSFAILLCGTLSLILWARESGSSLSKITLFSIGWFLIILFPTSSIFPTTQLLVENRAYLSGITIHLLLGIAYTLLYKWQSWGRTVKVKNAIVTAILGLHIISLCFLTVRRNKLFNNPMLLWEDVISKYPFNARAYNNLGLLYANQDMHEAARQIYNKAIQVNPGYVNAYYNMGFSYYQKNQHQMAIPYFQRTINLDPYFTKAHNNLGNIYYSQGKYPDAIKNFLNAIKSDPYFADGYNNIASSYFQQGEYERALEYYQKSIELNPKDSETHKNAGVAWFKKNNYTKALEEFGNAQQLSPNDLSVRQTVDQLRKLTGK